MKKRDSLNYITKYILLMYIGLFIFTSICRQFLLFGVLDLRYPTLIIGVSIIAVGVINVIRETYIRVQTRNLWLWLYILFVILCNFMWKSNQIQINEDGFRKLVILHIFNLCGFLVSGLFSKYITEQFIWKMIFFSCVILAISMILVYVGIPIDTIWGTGRKGANIIKESSNLTRNILGQNIRVAGYAEDPNYATLFLTLGFISLYQIKNLRQLYRIIFKVIFLVGIVIANSNTVVISFLVSIVVMLSILKINKSEHFILCVVFWGIVALVFLMPILEIGNSLTTLSSRYDMWDNAFVLFKKNPILGNGLSSFRSIHSWYVHCHSTYWSILSESGVIAFTALICYLYKTSLAIKDNKIKFLLIFYIIYCMMFDMTYMQITVVIFSLLPEVNISEQRKSVIYY